jgi:iron complex transport system substrate-binding protein
VWAIDADAYVVRPGPRVVTGVELVAWILAGGEGDPPVADAVRRLA